MSFFLIASNITRTNITNIINVMLANTGWIIGYKEDKPQICWMDVVDEYLILKC